MDRSARFLIGMEAEKKMKQKPWGRAVRCPECGKPTSSLRMRMIASMKASIVYCGHCGCPCVTGRRLYTAALIAGGVLPVALAERMRWPESGDGWYNLFLCGIVAAHFFFLWLVPYQVCRGQAKQVWGKADVKKVLPCPAEYAFRVIRDCLSQAYHYEIEGTDRTQGLIWVRQELARYLLEEDEKRWENYCLSVTPMGPERCALRVGLTDRDEGNYYLRQAEKLDEVYRRVEMQL